MVIGLHTYLFQDANSFLRAKLEEKCKLWGTDHVHRQIQKHILLCKIEAIVFIILQIFCNTGGKMFMNGLLFAARDVFFLSVLWYNLMNKKIFPYFCNNHSTLSHLELCFKQKLIVGLKIGEYPLSDILRHPPVWAEEYWSHAVLVKQKHMMDHKV